MKTAEEALAETNALRDDDGLPVDWAIRPLVAGLRRFDVPTWSSCEGHLAGTGWRPYVLVRTSRGGSQRYHMDDLPQDQRRAIIDDAKASRRWMEEHLAIYYTLFPKIPHECRFHVDAHLQGFVLEPIGATVFQLIMKTDPTSEVHQRLLHRMAARIDCEQTPAAILARMQGEAVRLGEHTLHCDRNAEMSS